MPRTAIWAMDCGTIAMPSSAVTRLRPVEICGAIWPVMGSKPALRQAESTS
jgi:hypothetical protein